MHQIAEVTVTYDAAEPAQQAARALVEARLAACAQISGPVQSSYWWDGAVQSGAEWLLTAKTPPELAARAMDALAEGHPYDLPAITLHLCQTTPEFAAWVARETGA